MSASNQTDAENSFQKVHHDEVERIKDRRKQTNLEPGNPEEDAVGLALSGGGVRSATFNLGLLQALERYGLRKHIDYLSTVSGGGYIGSSLNWFMSQTGKFPFGVSRKDHDKSGGQLIAWLRKHGSYLTPDKNCDAWVLTAAILRGAFVNLFILLPLFFALVYVLIQWHWVTPALFDKYWPNNAFVWIFIAGLASWGLMLFGFVLYALVSSLKMLNNFKLRKASNIMLGVCLKFGAILLIVGSLPVFPMILLIHDLSGGAAGAMSTGTAAASLSVSGVLSFILTWLVKGYKNIKIKKVRTALILLGLSLLIYGLMVWVYHSAFMYYAGLEWYGHYILYVGVPLSLLLGAFANINHVSMHRYYRDRLMEAYMPKPDGEEFNQLGVANNFLLKDIKSTDAPYHIINASMTTIDSDDSKLRARGNENFIFSPLYCGSYTTQYAPTKYYMRGRVDLATAFTISGASVDPNEGATRSRPLAFLMSLLNIRLGFWARNPARSNKWLPNFSHPIWHIYMGRELFGLSMDEKRNYVHLSDGGHFENLALYELIRRRCKVIIVSDAGEDVNWTYEDLANVCVKARVDFGAEININTIALHPKEDTRLSDQGFVTGTIRYKCNNGCGEKCEGACEGLLIYIKTCVISGLSEDIYGYRRANPEFPDQSTADQFFDESQFEAYRELGFEIGRSLYESKTFPL